MKSAMPLLLPGAFALRGDPVTVYLAGDSTMAEKLPGGLRDDTHLSPLGADIMAALGAEGIREARLGLARHLEEGGSE